MNHTGGDQFQKILLLILGAGIGAATGYMISEVLVYKLLQETLDSESPETETFEVVPNIYEKPIQRRILYEKKTLKDLTRDYTSSDGEEDDENNEIVDKAYVLTSRTEVETVLYYVEDDTYAHVNGELLDDPNSTLLPNAHLHFGEGTDEPDAVYILNKSVGLIYEVLRVEGSYAEEVLGKEVEEVVEVVEEKPKATKTVKRSRRAATPKKDPLKDLVEELDESDGK